MKFSTLRRIVSIQRWHAEHPESDPLLSRGCGSTMFFVICFIGILIFSSCKTREVIQEVPVEVPHYIHDTTTVVQKEKEVIHVTDSMWLHGDTVFKYRDRWREYAVHDTVRYVVRDSIGVPVYITKTVTTTKEVKMPLTWWQKTTQGIGLLVVLGVIGVAVWFVIKKKLWRF